MAPGDGYGELDVAAGAEEADESKRAAWLERTDLRGRHHGRHMGLLRLRIDTDKLVELLLKRQAATFLDLLRKSTELATLQHKQIPHILQTMVPAPTQHSAVQIHAHVTSDRVWGVFDLSLIHI